MQEYDFGSDKVPTVNSIVGEERKVTGVSTNIDTESTTKEYTYRSDSVFNDLLKYTLHLQSIGWTPIKDYNLYDMPGVAKLAIESADSGQILIISIEYDTTKYTVEIIKAKGTLTKYE
jgi:hypothetical protein